MKIVTFAEGQDWVSTSCGTNLTELYKLVLEEPNRYRIDVDSGIKNSLARGVAGICRFPALLWVSEVGVWPSSENMPMAEIMRLAFNETRSVQEAPVHLFEIQEVEILQAFLGLSLQCFWDALLVY